MDRSCGGVQAYTRVGMGRLRGFASATANHERHHTGAPPEKRPDDGAEPGATPPFPETGASGSRPVAVFTINGYWGMHNGRIRPDRASAATASDKHETTSHPCP
jgi:hypothetical protein